MSEVKVYGVYMATFSGHNNDTATLADPNGRYVSQADYTALQAELEAVRGESAGKAIQISGMECKIAELEEELQNAENVIREYAENNNGGIGRHLADRYLKKKGIPNE